MKLLGVSVVMAVYNTELYLEQAINSILAQSFTHFELIIVDDGSTDSSPQIIDKYRQLDSRIKVITQANAGIGAATQRAVTECCGTYIAIMDSDDISLPERLTLQKQYLDTHPEIDAVGSQWQMLDAQGKACGLDLHPTSPEQIELLMFAYFSLHHPTTMIRKCAIDAIGGYSADRTCLVPDYDLFMRLQAQGSKFANLPNVLFHWRLNPASTTRSKAALQASSVCDVRDRGFALLLRNKPDTAKNLARDIIHSFPDGTWQDHRVRELLPEHKASLLHTTYLALPANSLEEKLNRTIILWLREPTKHHERLAAELLKAQQTQLASLVRAHYGLERLRPNYLNLNSPDNIHKRINTYNHEDDTEEEHTVSIFVPFVEDRDDFIQRVALATQLQTVADFTIQLILFAAGELQLDRALLPAHLAHSDSCMIHSSFGWQQALASANGQYFAYLDEHFRFNNDLFVALLRRVKKEGGKLLYCVDQRYYSQATNNDGHPLADDSPSPRWTRETLLGKGRLSLAGFVHHRSLLNTYPALVTDCGAMATQVLARHLALGGDFVIHKGVVDYFIPPINLAGTPLPFLQKNLIDWFFDFGMGALPSKVCWKNIQTKESIDYAKALSNAWCKGDMILHPGNSEAITQFYLNTTDSPIHYPLFKHLLLHNKRDTIIRLWQKGAYLNVLLAALQCSLSILNNRMRWAKEK